MKRRLRSWLRVHPAYLTLAAIVPVVLLFVTSTPILDLIELKTDENSQLALINQLESRMGALATKERKLADFITESRRRADNDRTLAEAIKKSPATVILGYFFHMSEATLEYRLQPEEIDRRLKHLAGSKYPRVAYQMADMSAVPFIRGYAPE